MERYVVSRPLAEKLKAAGYPQNTWFTFYIRTNTATPNDCTLYSSCFAEEKVITDDAQFIHAELVAAPMTDELMEELPKVLEHPATGGDYGLGITFDLESKTYSADYARSMLPHAKDEKPVDALARLWLRCVENGYVKGDTHAK